MALSPQERSRRMRLNMLMAMSYAVAGRSTFTPLDLFSAGEVGAWYDPSDFSTMFEDSAGTTPVTAVEQPVGLILDKSKSLAIGPELITNGTFDTDTTGWTLSAGSASVSGGQVTISGVVTRFLTQAFTTVVGVTYKVTGQIVTSGATFNAIRKSDNTTASSNVVTILSAAGTGTGYFTATATTSYIVLQVNDAGTATFDNISVKSIAGNHASQTTSTSRPVLSARVNLLTYTEQFDNAAWSKSSTLAFGSGSTANATTAPDGNATADLVTSAAATAATYASQIIAVSAITYAFSVYAKDNGARYIQLYVSGGPSNGYVNFDIQTGTIGNSSLWTGTISSVGNGWFRLTATTETITAGTGSFRVAFVDSSTAGRGATFTGDGIKGAYLWGGDLRPSNQSTLPYQRVGAATAGSSSAAGTGDYDTTGFPYYLSFDGTDDSLATAAIDFSATDKMNVFAGIRKLSDAALTSIAELSASSGANNGTFALFGSNGVAANYLWRSRGTTTADTPSGNNYAAPITNVVTGIGDIANDIAVIRINGTQVAETLTDQGTGNYGSHVLNIGSRAGASQRFNGRLYALIVRGKLSTATEITNAETWVNSKTGAY